MPKHLCTSNSRSPSKMNYHICAMGNRLHRVSFNHPNRKDGYHLPQIIYSEHGEGILKTEGKIHHIMPNTAFFLPPNIPHEYYSLGDIWDTRWVIPDGYALDAMLKLMNLDHTTIISIQDIASLDAILDRMRSAIIADQVFGNYTASGILYEFLTTFNCLANDYFSCTNKTTTSKLLPVVDYIKKIMLNKYR